MEILKKYAKSFQWLFLLIVFFGLCFAIDIPEGYKFIRSVAEYSKDPNLTSYKLFGIEVRYYGYDALWRLPPLLGWLPIWVNDSLFFLLEDWMPIEIWDADLQETTTRPLVLQITRMISAVAVGICKGKHRDALGKVEEADLDLKHQTCKSKSACWLEDDVSNCSVSAACPDRDAR